MNIKVHSNNIIKVISIEGDLNANTSGEVETKLNQLIMGGNIKLLVNLDLLNYISSAGLRVFLVANKLIKKKNGLLRLCNLNSTVKEVFQISGFHLIFEIFETEEEALKDF
jgi:anti-sigma B factor antagonist